MFGVALLISIALNRDLDGDPSYVRCARCGTAAGSLEGAPLITLVQFRVGPGGPHDHTETPPEWTCPSCGRAGPLEVGELLENDAVMVCRRRWICRYEWRVPAILEAVTCPRCYTRQPGPAASGKRAARANPE
jgi:hypothetical protein